MGPEAESFRPLGMLNTLERLVDGSVAAHAMRQTCAHNAPPLKQLCRVSRNHRKLFLVSRKYTAAIALLADLSKAFERVNPFWILELLRIKRTPRWLFAYAKFVLFSPIKYKNGSYPAEQSCKALIWVGFFVYLFCLAMDPLFTYTKGTFSARLH